MRVHALVEDLDTARRAVAAGATVVQLRVKAGTEEIVARGRGFRDLGVTFVVNDDVEAAVRLGADGVHLGQGDEGAERARAEGLVLGRSISSAQSNQELADKLTRDFLQDGKIRTYDELRALLQSITVADVAAAAAEFGKGTILRVDVDPPKR